MHITPFQVNAISQALREIGYFYEEPTDQWTPALQRAYQEFCGKLGIENAPILPQPSRLEDLPLPLQEYIRRAEGGVEADGEEQVVDPEDDKPGADLDPDGDDEQEKVVDSTELTETKPAAEPESESESESSDPVVTDPEDTETQEDEATETKDESDAEETDDPVLEETGERRADDKEEADESETKDKVADPAPVAEPAKGAKSKGKKATPAS